MKHAARRPRPPLRWKRSQGCGEQASEERYGDRRPCDDERMNAWSWFLLRELMASAADSKTTQVIEVETATLREERAVIARLPL